MLEQSLIVRSYKFGLLYRAPLQTSENELYGNTDCSPAFTDLLGILGDRVTLKGFQVRHCVAAVLLVTRITCAEIPCGP
jgi:hypothetical protein